MKMNKTYLYWVTLVIRIALGCVFFYAGIKKIFHLEQSVNAVRGYQLHFLPYEFQRFIGYALPPLEIVLGLLLIFGLFTRVAAVAVSCLLAMFLFGIIQAWARGLQIDCGCFGGGGATEHPHYLREVLRDLGFMAMAVWTIVRPYVPLSVDRWLFGEPTREAREIKDPYKFYYPDEVIES